MDHYNGFDYVLTLVDNLSHFCQFIPTQKTVTGRCDETHFGEMDFCVRETKCNPKR
jgi:hypothetical protein